MEEAEKDLYEALTNLVQVADFSQLQLLIEKAEEIAPVLEEKYVPDEAAFAAFEEALENAKALTKDSAQADIDAAAQALVKAMADLRKKADKSELEELLKELQALDPADYTAQSYALVATAIKNMELLLADETLDESQQAVVDNAVNNARVAQAKLVKADDSTEDRPSKGGSGSTATVPDRSYGNSGIVVAGQKVAAASAYVRSDTTVNFTLKHGQAYCFKMTVVNGNGAAPNFTVGNGDVLKTQFVAQVGNDYYYRVYATGTPGQSTGVYTALAGNAPVKHCAVTVA